MADREFAPNEMPVGQIVKLRADHRPMEGILARVSFVGSAMVAFQHLDRPVFLVALICSDAALRDFSGHRIRAYEVKPS